jgi:hypothetical protein
MVYDLNKNKMQIKLSSINNRRNINFYQALTLLAQIGVTEILNDFGSGVSVGLDELDQVWETNNKRIGWRDLNANK